MYRIFKMLNMNDFYAGGFCGPFKSEFLKLKPLAGWKRREKECWIHGLGRVDCLMSGQGVPEYIARNRYRNHR